MQQHAHTLKTPLSNHGSHANRRTTVGYFFSKNIRQHLNPEVPTKFYRKERPHDLWRRSYHLRLSPTFPMFGQTNIGARLMAYPNDIFIQECDFLGRHAGISARLQCRGRLSEALQEGRYTSVAPEQTHAIIIITTWSHDVSSFYKVFACGSVPWGALIQSQILFVSHDGVDRSSVACARTWERTAPNNGHRVMRSSNQREAFL